jgi:hypothetical protein
MVSAGGKQNKKISMSCRRFKKDAMSALMGWVGE